MEKIFRVSTIDEEFQKAHVKGFIRTRKGKLERVNPFERKGIPKSFLDLEKRERVRVVFWNPESKLVVLKIKNPEKAFGISYPYGVYEVRGSKLAAVGKEENLKSAIEHAKWIPKAVKKEEKEVKTYEKKVKTLTSSKNIKDKFIGYLNKWQEGEDRKAFKRAYELYLSNPKLKKLAELSKEGMPDSVTLYRFASFKKGKKLKVDQKLKLKLGAWSSSYSGAEGTGAMEATVGRSYAMIKVKVPKKKILWYLNKITRSRKFGSEKEHAVGPMGVRVIREDPNALHEGKMGFVDAEIMY